MIVDYILGGLVLLLFYGYLLELFLRRRTGRNRRPPKRNGRAGPRIP